MTPDDLVAIMSAAADKAEMAFGGALSTIAHAGGQALGAVSVFLNLDKLGTDVNGLLTAAAGTGGNGTFGTGVVDQAAVADASNKVIDDIGTTLGSAIGFVTTTEGTAATLGTGSGAAIAIRTIAGDLGKEFARDVAAIGNVPVAIAFGAAANVAGAASTYNAFVQAGDSPGAAAAATFRSVLHGNF